MKNMRATLIYIAPKIAEEKPNKNSDWIFLWVISFFVNTYTEFPAPISSKARKTISNIVA